MYEFMSNLLWNCVHGDFSLLEIISPLPLLVLQESENVTTTEQWFDDAHSFLFQQNRYLIWGLVSKVWWMGLANMPFLWGTWALAHVYVYFCSGSSPASAKLLTHAPLDSN
jgi:hypothetical protein